MLIRRFQHGLLLYQMKVTNARVLLNGENHALDYIVPRGFLNRALAGWQVHVNTEEGSATGIVIGIIEREGTDDPTDVGIIDKVLGDQPILNPKSLELAHWLSAYYCSPIGSAVRCIEPPAQAFVTRGQMHRTKSRFSPRSEKFRSQAKSDANSFHDISRINPILALSAEQTTTAALIEKDLAAPNPTRPILLQSTSSNERIKIYLQVIRTTFLYRRTALVVVPEMSLTPRLVQRFNDSVHGDESMIAVLHSRLSRTEQKDEWHKILSGRAQIVIGGRQAVFAPLENLGLIVVDDEHESCHKQHTVPHYHAREVALVRGKTEKCVVILGSNTPSLESYFNAKRCRFRRLDVLQHASDRRPLIHVIDMRQEVNDAASQRIISRRLSNAIKSRLDKKEKTILLLNRRGCFSTLQCQTCGSTQTCPNCSVDLTFHRVDGCLRCHLCSHQVDAPNKCPECDHPDLIYSGFGTEKAESVVKALFPQAIVARMDADSMVRKDAYRNTLSALHRGEIDILVGTQMVSEGVRCPKVTLVGMLCADLDLHLPDFRAGERTFQFLMRLADLGTKQPTSSEFLLQAYTGFGADWFHFRKQYDLDRFYKQELTFRKRCGFPPFRRATIVEIRSSHKARAKLTAETIARRLIEILPRGFLISAAARAPLERLKSEFRFHILVRGNRVMLLTRLIRYTLDNLPIPEDVVVSVDVDALSFV
jgi:primosomal protein N' (replication factor Y)